ncbi:UGMP family protein [Candidatus Woesearchaeota archaeon]|nr:UGMP family protein [Candidatus Woesearchaeota archaeon]
MITLGIESTAHTLGIAITRDKEILSNTKKAYSTTQGGMRPVEVAEHHLQSIEALFQQSLKEANIQPKQIDLIAFSISPGIGNTLKIGAAFARSLSILLKKPLIGVNHCIAHLEIGKLRTQATDPVMLYASGANTQIIAFTEGKYRIFGETLDIGIGNFLDTFARELGLGFPGGPLIEKQAQNGKLIPLPYSVKGMDMSFGGLLTNLKQKIQKKEYTTEDLCYSAQHIAFSQLIEVTERALAHTQKKEIILAGGVACNKTLQTMAQTMCKERNATMYTPENQFLVDNAAMIAWTGSIIYNAQGPTTIKESSIKPYERTDEIKVTWT